MRPQPIPPPPTTDGRSRVRASAPVLEQPSSPAAVQPHAPSATRGLPRYAADNRGLFSCCYVPVSARASASTQTAAPANRDEDAQSRPLENPPPADMRSAF